MSDRLSNMEHLIALASKQTDACIPWDRGRRGEYGTVRAGRSAHREVCRYFHGEPPFDEAQAAHTCGVALCVNPRHIRWATAAENIADKAMHGTVLRGERHHQARLSLSQVADIRRATGSVRQIAERFGISRTQVWRIRTGKNWKES